VILRFAYLFTSFFKTVCNNRVGIIKNGINNNFIIIDEVMENHRLCFQNCHQGCLSPLSNAIKANVA
jgi:hypothetical protein